MNAPPTPLPIALVTGFLGSGKTSFLKHIAGQRGDRRIVYLVNEFNLRDIDGALVAADRDDVVSIPGGSIFCRCLVTEFINRLKETAAGRLTDGQRPDGVVIEASGMANPQVIEDMLEETRLDADYRLATIVTVLDPRAFQRLRHTLPNILAQVESADVVLINKTDCYEDELIAETEAAVRELNARASLLKTVQARADIDLFAEHAARGLKGEYAKCRDPRYETFLDEREVIDIEALRKALDAHGEEVYRVKGFARTADGGRVYVDYSSSGLTVEPYGGDEAPGLVWIVAGGAAEKVQIGGRA